MNGQWLELEEKAMKLKHDYYQRQTLKGYQGPAKSSDKFELSGKENPTAFSLFHKTVFWT